MKKHVLSRREMVQTASAAIGTGALAGLTGCIGEVPRASTIGSTGSNSYTDWLPAPGAIASSDHYSFNRMNLAGVRSNEDRIEENLYAGFEQIESSIQHTGVDFDEMETFLGYRNASVTTGSYAVEDVMDELEDNDFDDETEHEGYTVYLSADEVTAVGVGDQAMVNYSADGRDAVDAIETLIDTHLGDEDRYVEESEDFSTLLDSLGTGTYLSGRTYEEQSETYPSSGTFDHSVAAGSRWRINGDDSKIKRVVVFEEQDDVDIDAVEEWVSENQGTDQLFDDVDDVNVREQGRTATVTGAIDTDDVSGYEIG